MTLLTTAQKEWLTPNRLLTLSWAVTDFGLRHDLRTVEMACRVIRARQSAAFWLPAPRQEYSAIFRRSRRWCNSSCMAEDCFWKFEFSLSTIPSIIPVRIQYKYLIVDQVYKQLGYNLWYNFYTNVNKPCLTDHLTYTNTPHIVNVSPDWNPTLTLSDSQQNVPHIQSPHTNLVWRPTERPTHPAQQTWCTPATR